ncbi:MAG: hypothetical protein HY080_03970 [Gammaproteobacteria bacterium]|nr:hypothetical protein [Gammaproteobacteria bacterium]
MQRYTRAPQGKFFLTGCLSLLLTLPVSGCSHADTVPSTNPNTPIATPDGKTYLALERFDTKQGAFELGIAPCTAEGCAFEVRWLEKNKPVATIALPILAADQITEKEQTGFDWGADPGLYAWGTGMENSYVSTVGRLVNLDSETVGLLVTQLYGFDHLKRLHRLIVPRNGKLVYLWEFTESPGYSTSAAVVAPPFGITLFYFTYHYEESNADRLSVTHLVLNKDKSELVPASPGRVAAALLVGDFDSTNRAYKHRQADSGRCFFRYYVLASDSIATLPSGHSALARVFMRREEAQAEQQRLIQCGVTLTMSVVDIFSSPMLYQDKE